MYFKSIFYPLVGGTGYFFGFLVNGFTFPAFSQEGVAEFLAFFKFVFLGDAVPNLFGKSFKTLEVFFHWDTLQGFGNEVIGYFSGFEFVFDSDFTPFFWWNLLIVNTIANLSSFKKLLSIRCTIIWFLSFSERMKPRSFSCTST